MTVGSTFWTGPREDPRRYRVESPDGPPTPEPGSGGEGLVYRAVRSSTPIGGPNSTTNGPVALKLLLTVTPDQLGDIATRLEAISELNEPHLMKVVESYVGTALSDDTELSGETDFDDDDFDVCWIVADWIEGQPLQKFADDRGPRVALSAVADIATAVHRLHGIRTAGAPDGVLHRDVKTSNVRVATDGDVVLIDYGLARPAAVESSIVGTPGWLAPEVAQGQPGAKAADAYGVGAVAHDLLVGTPPRLDGANAARQRIEAALTKADVPLAAEIGEFVARLLESNPDARPTNLSVWADQLRGLLDGKRPPQSRSQQTTRLALVGVVVVAVIAAFTAYWAQREPDVVTATQASATALPVTVAQPPPSTTTTTLPCITTPVVPDTPEGAAITMEFAKLRGACAGDVERLGDAVIQRVKAGRTESDGVIIASPNTAALRLTDAQYSSYKEIAGKAQPTNSVLYGGYPVSMSVSTDPKATVMELSNGGLVVGIRDDTQSFWIPQQARGLWESHGGLAGDLGRPTSNVFFAGTRLVLEFERGYFDATVKGSADAQPTWLPIDASSVSVVLVPDPAAELAKFGDTTSHVLRQAGGQTWFVDSKDVRHWIKDGPTWDCLTQGPGLLTGDVPGYAVASLELGAPATCDTK